VGNQRKENMPPPGLPDPNLVVVHAQMVFTFP
jgi:hypothetical protein